MKKFLLNLGIMLVGSTLFAQTPFFQSTTYTGAFAPTPTNRWTDTWCNFDPQNAAYPTATVQVLTNITTNTTWTSGTTYWINDALIYVKPPAVLTIEPGTIIRGSGKGTLIIERGAKIIAQGTAASPIIFTSNSAVGARNYGDWGGVVLCGAGVHNLPAGPNAIVEGGIGDAVTQTGVHGGTNDDDSTGVFSYCRIEFCGISLTATPNSEINGLSMYSVGRKTKIDHVQVSYSGDDSFEWFGGAVDCRYLVAFRGTDDDFDTDNGYKGRVQFGVSFRDPAIADVSPGGTSNGFESDNDATGTNNYPKTKAIFSNITVIGPINTTTMGSYNSLYRNGAHIRRNSGISIFNSIFMGYPNAGLLVDSRKTNRNFCQDTNYYRHNIIGACLVDLRLAGSSDTLCMLTSADVVTNFMAGSEDNDTISTSAGVMLVDPYNLANPDARPNAGPASTGGTFTNAFLLPLIAAPNSTFSTSPVSATVCAGGSITFTGTSQAGTTLNWDIQGGTPSTSSATAPSSTFNIPGSYVVTLTATNALGTSSSTVTVTVNANPSTPSISQVGSVLSTGTFSTYQWYLNGSPIATATSQNWDADTTAGDYTVVVTNAAGCSATSAIYTYTTGLAAYTLTDNDICEGETITYTATTVGATSYSWIFTGGTPSTSSAPSVIVTYNTPGNYSTLLTVVQGVSFDNSNGAVTVNALPSPVITLTGSDLGTTLPYTTYQWNLNGSPIVGATNSTFTIVTNGAYTVDVTDANGCTNTSAVTNTNVGVEEAVSFDDLMVYPNPAEGFTTVSFDASSNGALNISVVDLNGRVVRTMNNMEYNPGKNIFQLDVQGISTGMYVLNIQTGNTYKTHKLIIK